MRRTVLFLILMFSIICLASLVGCSDNEQVKAEVKPEKPYDIYTHKDSDGCEYLIVYSKKDAVNGVGVGVGITPKVIQPESCNK